MLQIVYVTPDGEEEEDRSTRSRCPWVATGAASGNPAGPIQPPRRTENLSGWIPTDM